MVEFAPFVDVMGWAKTDHGFETEVITGGFYGTVRSAFDIPVHVEKRYSSRKKSNNLSFKRRTASETVSSIWR